VAQCTHLEVRWTVWSKLRWRKHCVPATVVSFCELDSSTADFIPLLAPPILSAPAAVLVAVVVVALLLLVVVVVVVSVIVTVTVVLVVAVDDWAVVVRRTSLSRRLNAAISRLNTWQRTYSLQYIHIYYNIYIFITIYTYSFTIYIFIYRQIRCQADLNSFPLENWRRPPGRPVLRGWRLPSRTWNHWTSPWMKQLTWLRIIHSGEWCLCTHSGHWQKLMNEWMNVHQQFSYCTLSQVSTGMGDHLQANLTTFIT